MRDYRRKKTSLSIVIEPTPAEIQPASGEGALVHLPNRVEQVRIVYSPLSQGERSETLDLVPQPRQPRKVSKIRIFALQYVRAESLATTLRQLSPTNCSWRCPTTAIN